MSRPKASENAELIEKRSALFSCKEAVNKTIENMAFHFKNAHINDDFEFDYHDGFWDALDSFCTEIEYFVAMYDEYKKLLNEYGTDIEPDLKGGGNDKD